MSNTFGSYVFPEWVPLVLQDQIKEFWGVFDRSYVAWLKSAGEHGVSEHCRHGPGPNGYRLPPLGARAQYFMLDRELSKLHDKNLYVVIEGRYIHAWNNMGRLVHNDGSYTVVSTCDQWVRVYD